MPIHQDAPVKELASHARGTSDYNKWLSAYRFAISNAAVFFVFSLLNSAFDNTPLEAHFVAASLFAIGSIIAFYRLCNAGGSLAAISFFVIGAGMAFGFGTAYSMHVHTYVFELLFSETDQVKNLPIINLMNSLSVLIVLMVSRFVAKIKQRSVVSYGLRDIFVILQMFRIPALILTGVYLLIFVLTFPFATDLLLRAALSHLRTMPLLFILLSFSMWRLLSVTARIIAIVVVVVMVVFGILEAQKSAVLFALLAVMGGLYLGRYRRSAVFMCAVAAVFYFSTLSMLVTQIRGHWQYDSEKNTMEQRATIVIELVTGQATSSRYEDRTAVEQLHRFLHAPYQSYLINEWREGRPGNSLADAWTALIPRFLWPDKPIITRFARELYGRIFRQGGEGTSSQAPTYTAEALWNYGWLGLVIVSILLGLELGWFTRKWLQFVHGQNSQLGIVVFAVPIAVYAIIVETWIGASYIGGFITLATLVWGADLLMPFFRWKRSEDRKASNPRARLAASGGGF